MAPARLSTKSSQTDKKQQPISSFFSSKPASGSILSQKPSSKPSSFGNGSGLLSNKLVNDDAKTLDTPIQPTKRPCDSEDWSSDSGVKRRRVEAKDVENASLPDAHVSEDDDLPRAPKRRSQQLPQPTGSPKSVSRTSDRTSKFVFSQDCDGTAVEGDEDEQVRLQKEQLHKRFVKKLGRPDSMANIRRRDHLTSKETEDLEEEDVAEGGEEEEEAPSKGASKAKKGIASNKASNKLTPMEKQFLDIKRNNLDVLLVIEVGYKYQIFGEDARLAARELQIVCIPGKYRYDEHPSEAHLNRFASASFPTHRLHVHVKRLVQAGHKVGVVRQLETAALKAVGDNRNAPFLRKLTNLYTKGTYIDDMENLDAAETQSPTSTPSSGHLLCLTETNAKGWGSDEKVRIGFVAVQASTGDVIYDDFEDGFMRSELETRLLHISPCEYLIVGDVSKATNKLITHISESGTAGKACQARLERVARLKTMAAEAYSHISGFYAGKVKGGEADSATALLDRVHQLSELVTICLSAMITHLTAYGLQHVLDLTKYFQSFSARSHMLINGNTLTSLEIYQNQTDHSVTGSLFWTLDKTLTRFGQRLLRKWVGRPLLDKKHLEERVKAVEELMHSEGSTSTDKLKRLLRSIKGDLEKSLIRIYYKKCTRPELLAVLQTLQMIANEYISVDKAEESGFKSSILGEAISSLPRIHTDVIAFLEKINLGAAREDDKYNFFREEYETEPIQDHKMGIVSVEYELNEHKSQIAEKLRKKKVEYVTSSGIDYLIEVDNTSLKNVPASWLKISGTKKLSRFHTPEVIKLVRERDQHKESLASACDMAFAALLAEIGTKYQGFRDCIQSLATLDCLLSLAEVSCLPGYCKPEFTTDETRLEVVGGRHPMVEQLLLDAYVPNDISLSASGTRALLVTGPNMGGKSSYVRSVALIAIMAQIGCFVPAESAKISLFDAVFTRMGAFDNMMKGESTFMVELNETSDILKQATPRSLVILDELGRGTSTHDGVAIAQAVLDYMLRQCKSLTLFITHYQSLARVADQWPDGELRNVHMRFTEQEADEGGTKVTFLYEVGEGTAHRSYGLNVAKLAGLPNSLIDTARIKSEQLEIEEARRRLMRLGRTLPTLFEGSTQGLEEVVNAVEQLG